MIEITGSGSGWRTFRCLVALGCEGGLAALLHRLDGVDALPPRLQLPAAVLRVAALVTAYWLLGGSILRLAELLVERLRLPQVVRWLAAPGRRVLDRALRLSLAGTVASAGAGVAVAAPIRVVLAADPALAQPGPTYTPRPAGGQPAQAQNTPSPTYTPRPAETTRPSGGGGGAPRLGAQPTVTTYRPRTAGNVPPPPPPPPPPPQRRQQPPPPSGTTPPPSPLPTTPPSRQTTHTVRDGDNLWRIARDRLADATNREPATIPDREIATYWLEVIRVNRARLQSGDPDLIYRGEIIQLPPLRS